MNRKELRHDRHTVSLLTDHLVFSPSYIAKRIKGSTSRILRKEFPHLRECVVSISGLQVVSMGQSGMDRMLSRSIFLSKINMNIIEKNEENDSYMPRYICTGYTVTADDRVYAHPLIP